MESGTLNTTAQVLLIILGFVAFLVEFLSDHFRKGEVRHNALRATKLSVAILVAVFGVVTFRCGTVLSEQAATELSAATNSLAAASQRIAELSEAAPRVDQTGRIVVPSGMLSYPSDFAFGSNKAKELFKQEKFADAFAEAERLSKKKPGFGLAYAIMGTVRAQEEAYTESHALLTKAVDLGLATSDLACAYHCLGIVALRQTNNVAAKQYFELAVETDPKMTESASLIRQLEFPTKPSTATK